MLRKFIPPKVDGNFQGRHVDQVFTEIYKRKLWVETNDVNQPFYSGKGSHDPNLTHAYVSHVTEFLKSFASPPNVVDIG